MSAMNECMTALIFTDLEYALKTFDVGKQEAIDLISNFKALQSLEFVLKLKQKVVKSSSKLNRMQISEKTGLPLSTINHILGQNHKKSSLSSASLTTQKSQSDLSKKTIQNNIQNKVPQDRNNSNMKESEPTKDLNSKKNEKQDARRATRNMDKSTTQNSVDTNQSKRLRENSSSLEQTDKEEKDSQKQVKRRFWTDSQIVRITKSGIVIRKDNKESFICYQCHKTFFDGMQLSRHFLAKHPQKTRITLYCPLCSKEYFDNTQKYTSHLKKHRDEGQELHFSMKQIENHIKKSKQQAPSKEEEQTEQTIKKQNKELIFLAEKLPTTYFNQRIRGKEHSEQVKFEKIDQESEDSDDQISVKTSRATIQKEKFTCDKCNRQFDKKTNLKIHLKVKHKIKPNENITISDKTFNQLEKEHVKVNFGDIV